MLDLPNVTLCCVDGINHHLALRALIRSGQRIRFARTLFFTDAVPRDASVPRNIEVVKTLPITSHEAYSRIVLKDLFPHVATSHLLLVQWDGYVAHPEQWQDEFLQTDYIGAPWPDNDGKLSSVGNGGFSLRSKRLLGALQDNSFSLVTTAEDVTICGIHRPRLEEQFGVRFAPTSLAKQFSFEMAAMEALANGAKTFGFHGVFNLFLVEPPAQIVAMVDQFSDAVARSIGVNLLLKNLVQFEMWETAAMVGRRILLAEPDDDEVASLVVRAREALALGNEKGRLKGSIIGRLVHRIGHHPGSK
jgi:Protein of unknown function (DUF5672)